MSRTLKLYRPSNGDEGISFQAAYCDHCVRDAKFRRTQDGKDGCSIIVKAMVYDVDDEAYPTEWRYDEEGYPICTKFKDVDDRDNSRPPVPHDPTQLVLIPDPTEDAAIFGKQPRIAEVLEVVT